MRHLPEKFEFEEFEKKKSYKIIKTGKKCVWVIGLAFIPFINLVTTLELCAAAELDLAHAIAKGLKAKVQEVAAVTVSYTLIPTLNSKNFIDGLRISKAAGFLPVMELELKKWKGKAEKSKSDSEELYHTFMKAKTLCQGFYMILPQVWTNFLTIETQGTDQRYVASGLRSVRSQCKIVAK